MLEMGHTRRAQECQSRMITDDKVTFIYYWLATAPQRVVIALCLQLVILEHFPVQAKVDGIYYPRLTAS